MTRSMINESNVSEYLWVEAVSTACYIINRVYLRPLTSKTAYEIFNGRKPTVSYFHIFGCKCFVLKSGLNLGEFDERSEEAIFVGYSLNSKAFRVFKKSSKVIEESINVRFVENVDNYDSDNENDKQKENNSTPDPETNEDSSTETSRIVSSQTVSDVELEGNSEGTSEGNTEPNKAWRYVSSHPSNLIIGDLQSRVRTRGRLQDFESHFALLSEIEPNNVDIALKDENWTETNYITTLICLYLY